jgi:hypothetical protein
MYSEERWYGSSKYSNQYSIWSYMNFTPTVGFFRDQAVIFYMDNFEICLKEWRRMIDIYTEKKDSKDWILQNDLYFNLNTGNEEMSQSERNLIQQVDEAKLTPDKHIETKYGLGTIRNLSSGCKTLLNIVKHPDKVVCVEECGPNVLKIIFTMDNIKIYMSRPTLADIPDNAKIRFNDSDIVTGSKGYNAWWSKEYERREADDLQEYHI